MSTSTAAKKRKASDNNFANEEYVEIHVDERIFHTMVRTIRDVLVVEGLDFTNPDGYPRAFRLDRNPIAFEAVLNYVRTCDPSTSTDTVVISSHTGLTIDAVNREIRRWNLPHRGEVVYEN